jgi:cell division protein FtsL
MNRFPEIGTFDVLGHGSDFSLLQSENAKLSNEKLILMIVLTAVVVGGAIYISHQNRQLKIFKADLQKQEKPTF